MAWLALVTRARAGWSDEARDLSPGALVAVVADGAEAAVEGRLAGLELRDTLLVARAGPRTSFIFLLRKPVAEATLADQALVSGTGGLNVRACRVGARAGDDTGDLDAGRWPPNVAFVHGPSCPGGVCEPTCPVALLDGQSGELTSGSGARKVATGDGHRANAYGSESRPVGTEMISYGDSGGAGRYYPQFASEEELEAWLVRLLTPP